MSSPDYRRIIWAEFPDTGGGHRKRRPAVVASTSVDPDGCVWVVCVTTAFRDSLRNVQTELQPGDETGLKEQCWAVSSWTRKIAVSDILEYAGTVSGAVMLRILRKMDELPP